MADSSLIASREERLARVVRWLLQGAPWTAFVATASHPAGTGWTLEDEAKEALHTRGRDIECVIFAARVAVLGDDDESDPNLAGLRKALRKLDRVKG